MVFQSWNFILFLFIVFIMNAMTKPQWRWLVLLVASYFFYGLTGWLPLILLIFSTLLTYQMGIQLGRMKDQKQRYPLLVVSVLCQVVLLGIFKYLGFFESVYQWVVGKNVSWPQLILPLGISFYTFQSMGYVFDVYYKIRKPEVHWGRYALFVSFFPQIQSGPIGRSKKMLPQLESIATVNFERFRFYSLLFSWGLMKKFVIADRLGNYIDPLYNAPVGQGAWVWSWTLALYTLQLYTDFSAYSDMARAIAGVLGIEIPENFLYPYKANNITDFWRRWHLSLSGWLRDYIYTPVLFGFKKYKEGAIVLAIVITFVICGIWHGAKITFVVFGIVQAVLLLFEYATKSWREKWQSLLPSSFYQGLSVCLTFVVVSFCFILFRADDMTTVQQIVMELLDWNGTPFKVYLGEKNASRILGLVVMLVLFIVFEERIERKLNEVTSGKWQGLMLALLLSLIGIAGVLGKDEFIYFQF
ncbi:MAG: hypothetical protein RL609_256 [Bacteroidota bacterium]|jgi:D-alanyl-lipoteichoic acid acyltransferase DltB (MBOAT superfamily)